MVICFHVPAVKLPEYLVIDTWFAIISVLSPVTLLCVIDTVAPVGKVDWVATSSSTT